jgi:hypothetical protein
MASKPESALQKTIVGIPEYVATGYVDLSAGMLPGIRSVDSHPSAYTGSVQAGTFPTSQSN